MDYKARLYHIIDLISMIQDDVQGIGFDDFKNNRKLKISTTNLLTQIVEIFNEFPVDFKSANPAICWDSFSKIKEFILDDQFGIKNENIWMAVKQNIKVILKNLNTNIHSLNL